MCRDFSGCSIYWTKIASAESTRKRYRYTLASEENLWRPALPGSFKGISLEGRVLETKGETLKLHLDVDEEQDKEKACFFPWSPITGNAMYAMPIVDTKARLHFPDGFEENAFAPDCVRENGDACPETADPDTRYFRTEHGKELMLSPSKLRFKDMNPNTGGKLFLELDDDFGIRISSHGDINMNAGGNINISAGGTVRFSAPANILFSQTKTLEDGKGNRFTIPESSFSLENEMHIRAKITDHRGRSRTPYMPYPNALAAAPTRASAVAKGAAKAEKKKDFGLGGFLKAAIAAVAVVVIPAPILMGTALALRFVKRAIGVTCALGKSSEQIGKAGRERAEDRLKAALSGSLVLVATGALRNPLIGTLYPVVDRLWQTRHNIHSMIVTPFAVGTLGHLINASKIASGISDYIDDHITLNYNINQEQQKKLIGQDGKYRYIHSQDSDSVVSAMKMGYFTADYNGCGWIATYNALLLLGKDQPPADIIKYYDSQGGTFVNGKFGINPESIAMYLEHQGIKTEFKAFPIGLDEEIEDAGIIMYTDIASFVHYVTIKNDGNGYRMYNEGNDVDYAIYNSIDDWVKGKERQGKNTKEYKVLALIAFGEDEL
jgi:hypothetical protein